MPCPNAHPSPHTPPPPPQISTRIARDTDQYGNYDPRKQQLAEIIFKYGMQSFPDSAFLVLQYANFLRIVRKDFSAAMAQILKAAKIPAGFNVRMMMFKVDKDHKATVQDHGLGAGEEAGRVGDAGAPAAVPVAVPATVFVTSRLIDAFTALARPPPPRSEPLLLPTRAPQMAQWTRRASWSSSRP